MCCDWEMWEMSEMCCDFVQLFQVIENLCRGCAYLLGKVCPLLATELGVTCQQLPIQHIPLSSVQVLVTRSELPEGLGVEPS